MEGKIERQMGLENPCLFLLSDDSSPRAITPAHRRSDTMSFMFGERSSAHLLKSITYPRKRRPTVRKREALFQTLLSLLPRLNHHVICYRCYQLGVDQYVFFRADADYYRSTDISN